MNAPLLSPGTYPAQWLQPTVAFLLVTQRASGEIPWFEGGHTDPWDHTEAAMGLSIAGELNAAERAYGWLAGTQLDDGSWWACYRDGQPDRTVERRETNYVAYVATGIWHHFLITGNADFLRALSRWSRKPLTSCCAIRAPKARLTGRLTRRRPLGRCAGDGLLLDLQVARMRHFNGRATRSTDRGLAIRTRAAWRRAGPSARAL